MKIKLTENELKQIVAESVKKILNEELDSIQEPKYKIGDKVEFEFDGGTWVGTITDTKKFPSCWNYKIYDFWHNEWDIIGKVK